jgi:hypothetical protein
MAVAGDHDPVEVGEDDGYSEAVEGLGVERRELFDDLRLPR